MSFIFQSANPITKANATFSRAMSPSSRCPIFRPIRAGRIVTGLSAITSDRARAYFAALLPFLHEAHAGKFTS
jgi:hypothetical protein